MSGSMPSSQRPFFLSSFLAAFRQPTSSSASPLTTSTSSQPNKHTSQASASGAYTSSGASAPRSIASSAAQQAAAASQSSAQARSAAAGGVVNLHSPRQQHSAIPIPQSSGSGRRRGSDSSSEGFREVMGADKWYIGGRTAGGEEKFFKMGVVRRVRSGDRLSIDRLSL